MTHEQTPLTIEDRLDRIATDLAYVAERQRRMEELVDEMMPIAKQAMGVAAERLAAMETQGYFRFGRAAMTVADRVVERYDQEELDAFAANVSTLLDTVRALTQPEVLALASEAGEVVQNRDRLEPLGVFGMVRAAGDQDVQRGMATMMELLRHVGRAADRMANSPRPASKATPAAPKAAPRTVARPAAEPAPVPAKRAIPGTGSSGKFAKPGASCKPTAPGAAAATLDGVGYTNDGFLSDPTQWTRELAEAMAATSGIQLEEARWKLIGFARQEWQETGVSPNIRRLTAGTGMATRDIYALFTKAPGKTIARLAGIPKPAGCI
ncbi:MAG: TusE/DsrC/DsvC family sulfur relay protein [Pseudomonadota bacterium]|nr:TusE/DsrC/DsvC family sulfur relay protein [Pseudomonadota bacterium]